MVQALMNPIEQHITTEPIVIKLGGSVFEDAGETLADIATLWKQGRLPILVHGGGPIINSWLTRLGIAPRFINGRRVTDAVTLDVVRTVLIGQVNSELVRRLTHLGVQAVGISGIDSGFIRARRADPALGLVGMVETVHVALLRSLCQSGFLPVIAPLCLGYDEECLNVNADDVATAIACALDVKTLVFMSNVPGVRDDHGEILPLLTSSRARDLISSGVISGGMVPKIESCLDALDHVGTVHIVDGAAPHVLTETLSPTVEHPHVGTQIVRA